MEPEVVLDKLIGLGSADAIANFFEQEGIQGAGSDTESCPVANYLRRETGKLYIVGTRTVLKKLREYLVDTVVDFDDDSPVRRFILDFDCGKYPNLISKDGK